MLSICHEAGGEFLRAPRNAFARIMNARSVVIDDAGPADFIRWLDAAPEDELKRVIELMHYLEVQCPRSGGCVR